MYKNLMLLVLMTSCDPAYCFRLVNAQMEGAKFYNMRDPLEPRYTLLQEGHDDLKYGTNEGWDYHMGLLVDANILDTRFGYLYLDQAIVGRSTTHQYRYVHWDWEIGISTPEQGLQVFWHHKSQHLLDQETREYPIMDMYGIRVCLLGSCKR